MAEKTEGSIDLRRQCLRTWQMLYQYGQIPEPKKIRHDKLSYSADKYLGLSKILNTLRITFEFPSYGMPN